MLFESKNGWIIHEGKAYLDFSNYRFEISNANLLPNKNVGYMYLDVKENQWRIYGFLDQASRDLFLKLIKINGIGCKIAANLCTRYDYVTLASAIINKNDNVLIQVSGVSKRLAQLIINQLSTKLTLENKNNVCALNDVVAVLTSLGLSNEKIMNLIQKYPNIEQCSVNEYLAYLLQRMD